LAARLRRIDMIEARCERIQEALGRIEARQAAAAGGLVGAEFRVFSQWGEDGILQRLVRLVPIEKAVFVEFGVQNYSEANTRFLLVNDNWSGLVIDGDPRNIEYIRSDGVYWQHNLDAQCAFVTRENINGLLRGAGITDDIGLLSIDVDGNDYWIWEATDCIRPRIVVIEYNARFGSERTVAVPYDPKFVRKAAHYSMIYYGASLAAFACLGGRKGYALVGCNLAGNNAFFVRNDVLPASLKCLSAKEAYKPARFRESRDVNGALQFLSYEEEQSLLAQLPVVDVAAAQSR
jgi:hypothetical protein